MIYHLKIESLKANLRGEFDYSDLLDSFCLYGINEDVTYHLIHEDTKKVNRNNCKCFEH